jgi:hypothetical protein
MSTVLPEAVVPVLPVLDELLEQPAAASAAIATAASAGPNFLAFKSVFLSLTCPVRLPDPVTCRRGDASGKQTAYGGADMRNSVPLECLAWRAYLPSERCAPGFPCGRCRVTPAASK